MTELDFVTIGRHIKERRKAVGVTQEAIAEYLDVNPSHISNIECGRAHPSLTALVRIADMLSCSVDCFLIDEYDAPGSMGENPLEGAVMQKLMRCPDSKKEKILKIMDII